jgi:hypothetical protein
LIEDKASPADETEVKQNKFIVVWKCGFTTKLQVKTIQLPGFRTTANTIDL